MSSSKKKNEEDFFPRYGREQSLICTQDALSFIGALMYWQDIEFPHRNYFEGGCMKEEPSCFSFLFCFPSNLSVKHRLRFYGIRQVCVYNCDCPVCEVPQDFVFLCTAFFGVYHHPQQTVGCSVCSLPLPWVHDSQPQPDSACLSRRLKPKQNKTKKERKKWKKERTFVRQHKCFHVQTCGACDCKCIIVNVKSLNMMWMVVKLCN